MSAQQPSSSPTRGVDDDGTDLGLAMGFATEHFANTCETVEASGQGYITATEGNQGRRSSTEETQQDDESSHSTTQRQASKDILRLLGVFEPQFIITMLHIRKNRRYRLKVIASTTVMDLATCAAANERVPVAKINLLQDNVVNVFCGGSFMVDGKGAITLSEVS